MLRSALFFLILICYCTILPAQSPQQPADSLRQAIKSAKSDGQRVELYLALFRTIRFAPPEETIDLFNEALPVAEKHGDPNSLGVIWYCQGVAMNQSGNFPEFIKANERALAYFSESGNSVKEISCQINIGSALMQMGKAEEGNELLAEALQKAKSKDDPRLLAIAQNNIAISFAGQGKFEEAEVYFKQALQTQLEVGDSVEAANAAGNLGGVSLRTGNYLEAIQRLVYAAEIHERLGNIAAMATNYLNISTIFMVMEDYESALEYAEQGLVMFEETHNANGIAMCLSGLGDTKTKLHDLEGAYQYYSRGIDTCRKYGLENEYYGTCLMGSGNYWYEKEEYQIALASLEEAEAVFQTAGWEADLPSLNILLGRIYQSQNRFGLAEQKFNTALNTATQFGELENVMFAHQGLAKLYEAWHKPSQALSELQLAESFEDSIFAIEKQQQIIDIQTKYDSERKKRLLIEEKQRSESLKFEKELIERRHQLVIQIAISVLVFLLLLSVAVVVWYRQKKRITEQENALTVEQLKQEESQRTHLEALAARQATEIGNRTKLLSEIKLELEGMKEKYAAAKPIEFMHLFKVVELNIRSDGDWEAFKQNFERLCPSFLEHLEGSHPNLSPGEQRLCVLVRLGMSKKDIANILNVNPDSVKRARNRLRHKLEIEANVELKDFLNTL